MLLVLSEACGNGAAAVNADFQTHAYFKPLSTVLQKSVLSTLLWETVEDGEVHKQFMLRTTH
jgi:hypothetical protein